MSAPDRLTPATRRVVVALVFGAILPLLDTSISNVALHALSDAFGVPVATAQWVISGYGLASALAIPLSGWATRRFGAGQMWIAALGIFTLASALCALAWNIEALIAFRLLQGVATGFSIPIMQTLVVTSAGKAQATRAMTAVGLPAVIAPAVAPLLGGLLIDTVGWRAIFLVNLPIGVAAIALALRYLDRSPGDPSARLSILSYLLLAPGLLAAITGLTNVGTAPHWFGGALIGVGTLLLGGYLRQALRTSEPLIDVRLFQRDSFASAWTTLALVSIVFYGGLFLIPLHYLQNLHVSALTAGLLLAVQSLGAFGSRLLSTSLTMRWGTRACAYLFVGCTVLGTVPFAISNLDGSVALAVQIAGLLLRGGGLGALTVLCMAACYHQLDVAEVVQASTAARLATQFGSAAGVAVCALLVAVTGGIHPATFAALTALTAVLAVTAVRLPAGEVVRR